MPRERIVIYSPDDDDNIAYERTTGLHRQALLRDREYRGYNRCTCRVAHQRSKAFEKVALDGTQFFNRITGEIQCSTWIRLWDAKRARTLEKLITSKRKGCSEGKVVDDYEYFYDWLGDDYDPDEVLRDRNAFYDIYEDVFRHRKYDHYYDLFEREEQIWLQNIEEAELEEDIFCT